ncbi:efflux RND transporter periplasmic adaptor subunit [Porphyromonadaceae bacterium OttesenSCG-928-L07]|nr:efflux RND transporter periplasmic adaptor subunit [Porphyromonadaceae bacterium OttesenSCG-928-L07]
MKNYLVVAGLLILFTGCREQKQENAVIRNVKADTVKTYGHSGSATFPGKVVASSDISLAFRVSGPILKIHTDIGTQVRKGDLLAQIDPRDYEVQLAATEAEYNRIKNEAERVAELYHNQSISPNDYDKAHYGYKQIAAKYDAHKNALADTRLFAPCDGYIQKRLFEAGETVGAGTPVISMVNMESGEVEINIPSSDYIRRNNFERYYCTIDVYPGKIFPLDLVGITRKANMNQLYTAKFRLVGEESGVPGPGMSTMVTIQYKPETVRTVFIPLTCVFYSDKEARVWVYNADSETVSLRSVVLSQILTDGTVVISSGLTAGEIVLSAGVHSVKEGEKVKLLPSASSTNVGGML